VIEASRKERDARRERTAGARGRRSTRCSYSSQFLLEKLDRTVYLIATIQTCLVKSSLPVTAEG
jgi:hypothetical protein